VLGRRLRFDGDMDTFVTKHEQSIRGVL